MTDELSESAPKPTIAKPSKGMNRKPKIEADTVVLVHKHFDPEMANGLIIEQQSSANPDVSALFVGSSKRKKATEDDIVTGQGFPDFILSHPQRPSVLVIIECKADPQKHETVDRSNVKDYAVDGVLHYAKFAKKQFDVVALAVSGTTLTNLKVSAFKWTRGAETYEVLSNSAGSMNGLYPWHEFVAAVNATPSVHKRRYEQLLETSKELHDYLYANAKVTEEQKPLLVSACLIALKDQNFIDHWQKYTAPKLAKELYTAVEDVMTAEDLPEAKRLAMLQPYGFIATHPVLSKVESGQARSPLHHILTVLSQKVAPFVTDYPQEDVLGQFYGEFLKYTAGDGKGLGIVLTPRHVTELFADLADVTQHSVVVDPCTGTGGFLISAMDRMVRNASMNPNPEERTVQIAKIKSSGLIGIEQMPHMFALAASNMFLRGDGKSNLYQGDCFDETLFRLITTPVKGDDKEKVIERRRPKVGLINPPYAQKGESFFELDFVKHMLDMLAVGGIGVAIVPMSCATARHPTRDKILKEHTLLAAMSMPDDLFYPVGTVTCILMFEAHKPHDKTVDTWFGYWKNDGYYKTKKNGRTCDPDIWEAIKSDWLNDFRNRSEVPGRCVKHKVTASDEWCAEAYLETDYSTLTTDALVAEIRKYAIFRMLDMENHSVGRDSESEDYKDES